MTVDLRRMIDALDVGALVHDREARIVFANAAVQALVGIGEADLLGQPWCGGWDVIGDDGVALPPSASPVARVIATRSAIRDLVLGARFPASPQRVWTRVSSVPVLDEDGGLVEVVTTLTDLTHTFSSYREREQELRRVVEARDQLYRAVIESMAEGVVVHAPDGQIVAANPAATRILGLTLDQLTGRSPRDPRWALVRGDGAPLPIDEIPSEVTRRTGVPCRDARLGVLRPDGERRWLSVSTAPVEADAGGHVVATITDVTDARQIAETLRRSARVEAMGELAAGIAHNFNNLLAVIVPNLELAMAELGDTGNTKLADAYAAALSGSDLVKQLLRVVRREPEAQEVVDVHEVASEVVRMCQRTFDRRVAIVPRLGREHAHVRCRAADLQQVLLNLCINARDAMEAAPTPRLVVSMRSDRTADLVELSISDNGAGMTEETQRRLGDPFFTTKGASRGTGLGIASAIGIVRDAGGSLTWSSRPGEGTTFVVRLPMSESEPSPRETRASAERAPRLPDREVLVVDDDDQVRHVLERLIESLGPSVTCARSGAEALELVGAAPHRFAVVLLDLSMPGLAGDQVLAKLRALAPALPVIMMTGYLHTAADLDGAAAVLTKPFGGDELGAALARVLGLDDRMPG